MKEQTEITVKKNLGKQKYVQAKQIINIEQNYLTGKGVELLEIIYDNLQCIHTASKVKF